MRWKAEIANAVSYLITNVLIFKGLDAHDIYYIIGEGLPVFANTFLALPLPSTAAEKAELHAGGPNWGDSNTSNWMCQMFITEKSVYCIRIMWGFPSSRSKCTIQPHMVTTEDIKLQARIVNGSLWRGEATEEPFSPFMWPSIFFYP